jgi:archaellum component FlaC
MKKLITLCLLSIVFSLTAIAQEEKNSKSNTILDLPIYEKFVDEFKLTDKQQEKAKKIVLKAQERAASLDKNVEDLNATINEMIQEFEGLVENNVLPRVNSFFEKLEKEVKK